jgi:hypothetical protein
VSPVLLWPYVVIIVPSGRVGVYWKRIYGSDFYCWCFVGRRAILDPRELREEGLHFIAPWDKLFIYGLRLQSATETVNAISKDGCRRAAGKNRPHLCLTSSPAASNPSSGLVKRSSIATFLPTT